MRYMEEFMKMKLLYLGLIFGCSSLFAMEMPEAPKNVIEENLETALKNFPELYSQFTLKK